VEPHIIFSIPGLLYLPVNRIAKVK
jgi:hypothetical protein